MQSPGKIEFYEKYHQEDLWKQVGADIYGRADYEVIGLHYL